MLTLLVARASLFQALAPRRAARAGVAIGLLTLTPAGCQPDERSLEPQAYDAAVPLTAVFEAGVQTTAADAAGPSADAATDSGTESPFCPPGMALVQGSFCPYMGHRCVEWLNEKQDRCQRYAAPPICEGKERALSVCVDMYEYPNQPGTYPVVMTNYLEAAAACEKENKRLCTESEWTLACEGNERLPYPYGYERDPTACNIDRTYRVPDMEAFSHESRVAAEVARLDQRVASGSMPRCKSPFGVYDMTGNVDEWVVNETRTPDSQADISGLKGGYFGPIRARCRPMTTSHNRWFRFYQVGFRCCADPLREPARGEVGRTPAR
jgi:hypothetical protein